MKEEVFTICKVNDPILVENFVRNAGNSLLSFRYFNSRSYSVIHNHLVTYLLYISNQGNAIGYGHLEFEADKLWLGIAISELYKGKGFGKKMLSHLLDTANEAKADYIYLSVDIDNKTAINLYERFGFLKVEERNETIQIMRLTIHG